MDAECKAIEKKLQAEVEQFKSLQKGQFSNSFAVGVFGYPMKKKKEEN